VSQKRLKFTGLYIIQILYMYYIHTLYVYYLLPTIIIFIIIIIIIIIIVFVVVVDVVIVIEDRLTHRVPIYYTHFLEQFLFFVIF